MRVAFLGLGLIGGSIALATRSEDRSFVAWTPDGDGPRRARSAGVVDEVAATPEDAIRDADLVILAAPPLDCLAHIAWLGGDGRAALHEGVTVTDVASTKGALTAAARRAGIPFVGGHPMAGRELTGFGAATADLFRDRPWVVTEAVGGGDPAVVEALARAAGARPIAMAAAEHDAAVAAISHLPLIASVALVEAVLGADDGASEGGEPSDAALVRELAASGWRDMTRLARGDVAMGAGIAVTNASALAMRLRAYRDRIDAWVAALEGPGELDSAAVGRRLEAARRRLGEGGR